MAIDSKGSAAPEPGRPAGFTVAVLLVLAAGVGYGSIFAANKIVGEAGFPPIPYVFWQTAIGAAFLLIVSALTSRLPRLDPFSLAHYAASGGFGQVIPFLVLAFVAVKLPSGVVTLTTTLIPGFTYLYALTLRIETFRALSLAGIVLGLVGVLMIVLPAGGLSGTGSVVWVLVALLFPIGAATNNMVVAKLRPPNASSAAIAGGVLTAASIVLFVLMLIVNGFTPFWDQSWNVIGGLAWATGIQILGYFALYEVIRRAGPVLFSQMAYLIIIAGLFWALVLFDERLSNWVWGAIAVMVSGLVLSNFGAHRARRDTAAKES